MMKGIIKTEGVTGLYRGLPGIWIKDVPGSFLYFGSYELAKSTIRHIKQSQHLGKFLLILFHPIFLVTLKWMRQKTGLKLMPNTTGSRVHCGGERQPLGDEGTDIRFLQKNSEKMHEIEKFLIPSAFRYISHCQVYFCILLLLFFLVVGSRDVFLCGTFAGLFYCITHPLEAVKTRVQVMSAIGKHKGFLSSLVHIVKYEGKHLQHGVGVALGMNRNFCGCHQLIVP